MIAVESPYRAVKCMDFNILEAKKQNNMKSNLKELCGILSLIGVAGLILSLTYRHSPHPMVIQAQQLLESFSEEQKENAHYDFEHHSRLVWEFLPVAMASRPGISMRALHQEQQQLVHQLLESALSEEGYLKTQQIISLEDILRRLEPNNWGRDRDQYHIAIYGSPGDKGTWAWKFEGHHLSLNFTFVDGRIATSPTFLGANPAEVRDGPKKGLRVLKDEEDLALQLVNSLDDKLRQKAIFKLQAFYDIVTAKATEVAPLDPVGITAAEMNNSQKELLFRLIDEYIAVMPEALANERKEKLEKAGKDGIRFGWAGATELGKAHYYRIQGPTFLIEFDNTQNNANHIHSVWRDYKGDFGRDILQEHYRNAKHHAHD